MDSTRRKENIFLRSSSEGQLLKDTETTSDVYN